MSALFGHHMSACSLVLLFQLLFTGQVFNVPPYTPYLQRIMWDLQSTRISLTLFFAYSIFLPPLTEPVGGLQPEAPSPEPGSMQAGAASGPANPTEKHIATEGGSAARSLPMCQEGFETLTSTGQAVNSWRYCELRLRQTLLSFSSTQEVYI